MTADPLILVYHGEDFRPVSRITFHDIHNLFSGILSHLVIIIQLLAQSLPAQDQLMADLHHFPLIQNGRRLSDPSVRRGDTVIAQLCNQLLLVKFRLSLRLGKFLPLLLLLLILLPEPFQEIGRASCRERV